MVGMFSDVFKGFIVWFMELTWMLFCRSSGAISARRSRLRTGCGGSLQPYAPPLASTSSSPSPSTPAVPAYQLSETSMTRFATPVQVTQHLNSCLSRFTRFYADFSHFKLSGGNPVRELLHCWESLDWI